jgi:2-desacetyl-2-hydroxyethyl bacteriochlorophyllide A dehydrogenase
MRRVVLRQPGAFEDTQVPSPRPQKGEALVRVRRIGVCGTDLHAFTGRQPFFNYPRVLGHELGVEILEAPADRDDLKPGDRCAIEPYLNCGQCGVCKVGRTNCCERLQCLGVHTDGGMCGLLTIAGQHLHKSEQLSFDQLALVETLGIGAQAVKRSGLKAHEEVLIVGAGPIGLAVLQFALAVRGRVCVLDVNANRRAFAAQFGVETLAEPDQRLFDVVFDATGNAQSMEASFDRVAHGGRLVFVGLVQGRISFDDPLFHRREMTILASRNSAGLFPTIMGQIERGEIDTTPWITHRLGLWEVPEKFPGLAGQPQLVKAMIEVADHDL